MNQDAKTVLREAVHREQGAYELYLRLAALIDNPEGAKIFKHLAADEAGHRERLEQWWHKRHGEAFPFDPGEVGAREVEIGGRADALDALEFASQYEQTAAKMYEAMAAATTDKELRAICRELAEQEWGHFETLRAEISAVTGDFYWFDIDTTGHVED